MFWMYDRMDYWQRMEQMLDWKPVPVASDTPEGLQAYLKSLPRRSNYKARQRRAQKRGRR